MTVVTSIFLQILPFVHVLLACVVTAITIRKRRDISAAFAICGIAVAWLIPIVGPFCILWAVLRRQEPHGR